MGLNYPFENKKQNFLWLKFSEIIKLQKMFNWKMTETKFCAAMDQEEMFSTLLLQSLAFSSVAIQIVPPL